MRLLRGNALGALYRAPNPQFATDSASGVTIFPRPARATLDVLVHIKPLSEWLLDRPILDQRGINRPVEKLAMAFPVRLN